MTASSRAPTSAAAAPGSTIFGTVRGRLGFAFDRALIYVTGGLAYGGVGMRTSSSNTTRSAGWTVGGGLEYAFTNNWTAKIEGLYVNIDRGNNNGDVSPRRGRSGRATRTRTTTSASSAWA